MVNEELNVLSIPYRGGDYTPHKHTGQTQLVQNALLFKDPWFHFRACFWRAFFARNLMHCRRMEDNTEVKHLVEIMDLEEKPAVNQAHLVTECP